MTRTQYIFPNRYSFQTKLQQLMIVLYFTPIFLLSLNYNCIPCNLRPPEWQPGQRHPLYKPTSQEHKLQPPFNFSWPTKHVGANSPKKIGEWHIKKQI